MTGGSRAFVVPGPKGSIAYLVRQMVPIWIDRKVERPCMVDVDALPEIFDVIPPEILAGIDGARAQIGKRREDLERCERYDDGITLMLVPTLNCHSRCVYCYARETRGSEEAIDPERLRKFLLRHGSKFRYAIVYGGDPLTLDWVPELLAETRPGMPVDFVTGMGFERAQFELKASRIIANPAFSFTFSIDPPPADGKSYLRNFAPAGGPAIHGEAWYREQLDRIAWVASQMPLHWMSGSVNPGVRSLGYYGQRWAVRPTVSRMCYDFRRLRDDLRHVTGREQIPMNIEPAVMPVPHDVALRDETLVRATALIDEDVREIVSGALDLRANQHLHHRTMSILNPDENFAPGGCFVMFNRLSIGSDGGLSFCNETQTYSKERRLPWSFGDELEIDAHRYGALMERLCLKNSLGVCKECDYLPICGVTCPIKLESEQTGGCAFAQLMCDAAFAIMANAGGIEHLNDLLPQRLDNLQRWQSLPVLTAADFARHARWLMR